MNNIKKNMSKWLYWFLLGISIIGVLKILDNFAIVTNVIGNFFHVISPFLIGILIAYILYIPASKIEALFKKSKVKFISKRARGLGVFFAYLIAILLIIILLNVIMPVIIDSVIELVNNFQGYYQKFLNSYQELPEDSIFKGEHVTNVLNSIREIDFTKFINMDNITMYAKGAISVVTSVFDVFVIIIVSIYGLLQRRSILDFCKKLSIALFGDMTSKKIGKYFNSTNQIFFKFLASQLLDAVVVGIITTIGMSILGVKYAVLLGFIIGLFNIIPYFGAIAAVGISILITLITGGLSQAIWMAIVVIVLQQIDANIINPKIVGNSLEISPLLVIFAVAIGGEYFGVLGMFLAVPVVAVLKILVNDYIEYRMEKKKKSSN